MNKITLLTCCAATFVLGAQGQTARILKADVPGGHILTLRTEIDGVLENVPVIRLGSDERVAVSFDEMSHEYHRYLYRLQHCDALWRPTEDLFFTEYAEATQEEIPIEEYTESQNVTTHYTHYSFDFPNEDLRPLLSGNYRITILSDDADEPTPVAEVCVGVTESAVSISADMTTNTDVDWAVAHQQIEMEVDCKSIAARDLREEVRVLVMQNDRLDNAAVWPMPSYVNGSRLIWEHSRDLIFTAGNEYRKFENLSARYPGLHTESIHYFEPYLHATIMDDEQRRNYLATEDANGINVLRNVDNQDDVTETEYMITHFRLLCDEPWEAADVYLNGRWTTGGVSDEWMLRYDETEHAYVGAFMLKQGYYNYQYLLVPREGKFKRTPFGQPQGLTETFEGDYFQTENDYRILVYYKAPGARYERLVGMKMVKGRDGAVSRR